MSRHLQGLHRRLARIAWASLALAVCAAPAYAFRPFEGTDAQVAPPRAFELELEPMGYERAGGEHLLVGPEWGLNYGFGDGYEFTLEGKRLWLLNAEPGERVGAFEDIGLSVKKVLRPGVLQEKPGTSLATEIEAQLPTTTERGVGWSGALIATREMGIARLHFNGLIARNREHDFARAASVILELAPRRWKLKPVAEASVDREGDAPTDHGVLGGLLWEAAPSLTIDGAVRYSSNAEHDVELLWGFTWKKHVKNGPKI
jgi:hypothetical protein